MTLRLPDSHSHLQEKPLADELPAVLERAHAAGIATVLVPGTDPDTSEAARDVAERYGLWFSAGVHPEDPSRYDASRIAALLSHPRCVAVGEIGLDHHFPPFDAAAQEHIFRAQIDLARQAGLPVIIHARDADRDLERILRDEAVHGGVCHCFGGDRACLETMLELGFTISFAGNLTYRKATFRDFVTDIPRDRLLVETDAPFLAPVPHRGTPNEPAYTVCTLRELARLRQEDPEVLGAACLDNFYRCFPKAVRT